MSLQPEFSDKIRRAVIDGEVHFSILDVFALHSDVNNAWRSWKRAEKLLINQGFAITSKSKLFSFMGPRGKKTKSTPVATFNTFLRIAQAVDFKDWEHIRQFMADAAEERIDETARFPESKEYRKLIAEGFTPEEARQWLERRAHGIETRKWVTEVWRKREARGKDFAILTNIISDIVHGKTATVRKRESGLTRRDTMRNYDAATDQFLTALTEMSAGALHEWRDSIGFNELSEDVEDTRPIVDGARPGVLAAFSKKPRRLPSGEKPLIE